jgi:SAM-dependent methyltransferase
MNQSENPKAKVLFDGVAGRFAREIDQAIHKSGYVRGAMFSDLAQRTIPAGADVLDYGCGPGRLSVLLAGAGFRVRGVDISSGMIEQARALDRQGLNLEFDVISNSAEALAPASCDAIVCSSVIEYVVDADALLRQFHAALRRPGVLLISYANRTSLWRRYWDWDTRNANPMYAPENQSWSWRTFRAKLANAGFQTQVGPCFFESPCDWMPGASLFRRTSLAGSLGVVAARPSDTPRP